MMSSSGLEGFFFVWWFAAYVCGVCRLTRCALSRPTLLVAQRRKSGVSHFVIGIYPIGVHPPPPTGLTPVFAAAHGRVGRMNGAAGAQRHPASHHPTISRPGLCMHFPRTDARFIALIAWLSRTRPVSPMLLAVASSCSLHLDTVRWLAWLLHSAASPFISSSKCAHHAGQTKRSQNTQGYR